MTPFEGIRPMVLRECLTNPREASGSPEDYVFRDDEMPSASRTT
jgi:hypothetical protein